MRITLQHPKEETATLAMWWKVEEGINSERAFAKFREAVLNTPIEVKVEGGQAAISIATKAGKLGVCADLKTKQRLQYYNPSPLPQDFLINLDGVEIGKPVLEKFKSTDKDN